MGQDLYTQWLDIAPDPRPPDYYALLGLERFCQDVEAIESATRARLTRLDEFAMHPDRDTRDAVQDMMNEVARARVCLVNPAKRHAYDQRLRGGAAAPTGAAQAAVAPAPAAPRRESVFERGEPVFAQDEQSLAGTTPAGREPGAEAAVRTFEALVWKHLGRWKLGPQEERLLVAEAADLGIAADAARRIIRKIDRAAEDRADRRHKWTVGIVVASAVLIVAGLLTFVLVSNHRSSEQRRMETNFTTAIADANARLALDDFDAAGLALARARNIFPDDPRLAELSGRIAAARARAANETAFVDALNTARDCLARSDLDGATRALANAAAILPDDPRRKALEVKIADAKTAIALLGEARSLFGANKYDEAGAKLDKILSLRPDDADAMTLKKRIDDALASTAHVPPPATQATGTHVATSQPAADKPGDLTVDLGGGVSMRLALIPAGKFMMGPPDQQQEARIAKPFYMSVFEVTQEQFERVTGNNHSKFRGSRNPADMVTWYSAELFCKKLSASTGRKVFLPTQAQWEYACRAGKTTRFGFGDNEANLGEYGWFAGNSGNQTHPVGGKKPNDWGLYDMQGNVSEWCSDGFEEVNNTGLYKYHAFRGGCWNSDPSQCQSASSSQGSPNTPSESSGFRIIVDLTPEDGKLAAQQEADRRSRAAASQPACTQSAGPQPAGQRPANAQPAATQPAKPTLPRPSGRQVTVDLGNGVKMKLNLIPAGKFIMGSPQDEQARNINEGPPHVVTLSKPFYMGVYEVTQEQYERLMGDNPSREKAPQFPVHSVSWYKAVEFCQKLSRQTSWTVTLPTEAQWEYACRARTTTRYCCGDRDADLDAYAWTRDEKNWWKTDIIKTHTVGKKKPNGFGLYDMHGNADEWCSDWYADSYPKASSKDPAGPDAGQSRVTRGGSWQANPSNCRSASRFGRPPYEHWDSSGFRVVVEAK